MAAGEEQNWEMGFGCVYVFSFLDKCEPATSKLYGWPFLLYYDVNGCLIFMAGYRDA